MKNIAFFPLFALLLCIAGCSQTAKQHPEGFKVYQVNLDEKVDPFKEIFSKAEVIPLETADSGLIIYMNKVFPVGDEYFIHEREVHKLYVFGKDGKYKRRISRYGQGPNDYISMFDCVVDAPNNDIYMLGVFGQVKRFDMDGILCFPPVLIIIPWSWSTIVVLPLGLAWNLMKIASSSYTKKHWIRLIVFGETTVCSITNN